jgi:hypothetical protein
MDKNLRIYMNLNQIRRNKIWKFSYDQSFNRPNFKSPGGRGAVL